MAATLQDRLNINAQLEHLQVQGRGPAGRRAGCSLRRSTAACVWRAGTRPRVQHSALAYGPREAGHTADHAHATNAGRRPSTWAPGTPIPAGLSGQ